jgi:hypothetical protein
MSNIYDEESQIEDLNVEADRVIAMNPSGVIENFVTRDRDINSKNVHCDGDKCVILGDDEVDNCVNGVCETKSTQSSYSKYINYFVIFLTIAICVLAYFLYKKYYCSS